jgi:poly(3-hydroxybutyrate) depolymerase
MMRILKYLPVVLFTIVTTYVNGQQASETGLVEMGRIIDSVFTEDGRESFALYVPEAGEDAKHQYPLILIFDPMARGTTGLKPFILSSEAHGYILACSNDARNGPYAPNQAIGERMFERIGSMFSIDPKRIYTSGFSGGSRLASRMAIGNERISGVIACGAGLPEGSEYQLLTRRFHYAAIIGNKDMNFLEFQDVKRVLSQMSFPHDVVTINLDHRWPAPESVLMATDWLQLEYFKSYPDRQSDRTVKEGYQRAYDYLRGQEELGHLIETAEGYNRLLLNYRRHCDVDSIRVKRDALLDSREYRAERRSFEASLAEERRLTEEFWNRFGQDIETPQADLKWWRKQLERLDGKAQKEDRLTQNMHERLKYKVFAHALETARFRTLPDAYAQKEFCYELCTLIYPRYYYPYFIQMELALEQGDQKKALEHLSKMIANGYQDKDRLLSSKAGRQLREEPEFRSLIDRMKTHRE